MINYGFLGWYLEWPNSQPRGTDCFQLLKNGYEEKAIVVGCPVIFHM